MSIITKSTIENGKKIITFLPSSKSLDEMGKYIEMYTSKRSCDEFRLKLPDKTLIFTGAVTTKDLHRLYRLLSKEEYRSLEYDVTPLDKTEYSKEELHAFYMSLLDFALFIRDFDWAKELHDLSQIIVQNKH